MFDIGWSEFLIVGAIALVLLGPEELPVLMRTIGRYTGMIKRQAAEFRSQFEEAMREAELEKLRKDVEATVMSASRDVAETERSIATPHQPPRATALPPHAESDTTQASTPSDVLTKERATPPDPASSPPSSLPSSGQHGA